MENQKLGQEPAFPNENTEFCQDPYCYGMSKRFYAACAAMQGILSSSEITVKNANDYAEMAFDFADELLKQENL